MDVWQFLVFAVAYAVILALFVRLGGFGAAGTAIRRWGRLTTRGRTSTGTSSYPRRGPRVARDSALSRRNRVTHACALPRYARRGEEAGYA